jgi:integrase
MKILLDWFGSTPAGSLTPQQIEHKLTEAARKRGWKPATINRYKALLSLVYRIAVENGKVQMNPARLVRRRREDNAVIRYLKEDEETRLRAAVEPRHPERWAEIVFAMNTGLRASEQSRAQWDDIDAMQKPPQLRIGLTKRGPVRYVPLNRAAQQALETMRAIRIGQDTCLRKSPTACGSRSRWKRPGSRTSPGHCLRHTFASRLVMAGVDIRTVAELMGHKSLQMTMRYAHLASQHNAQAVAKLDKVLSNRDEAPGATDTKTRTKVAPTAWGKLIKFPQVQAIQKVAAKPGP